MNEMPQDLFKEETIDALVNELQDYIEKEVQLRLLQLLRDERKAAMQSDDPNKLSQVEVLSRLIEKVV
jgi:hypothetical protein